MEFELEHLVGAGQDYNDMFHAATVHSAIANLHEETKPCAFHPASDQLPEPAFFNPNQKKMKWKEPGLEPA